jgi:hypothetical protein
VLVVPALGVLVVSLVGVLVVSDGDAPAAMVSLGADGAGVAGWAGLAAGLLSVVETLGATRRGARGFRGAGLAARALAVSCAGLAESVVALTLVSVGLRVAVSPTLTVSPADIVLVSALGAAPDRCSPPQPTIPSTRRTQVSEGWSPLVIERALSGIGPCSATLSKDCVFRLYAR